MLLVGQYAPRAGPRPPPWCVATGGGARGWCPVARVATGGGKTDTWLACFREEAPCSCYSATIYNNVNRNTDHRWQSKPAGKVSCVIWRCDYRHLASMTGYRH